MEKKQKADMMERVLPHRRHKETKRELRIHKENIEPLLKV